MATERIADHVTFVYWVPNVSGGLVTSDIEQRTDWNYEYNAKLAQTAENNGFEYQHESTSFSLEMADAVTGFRRDHGSPRSTPAACSRLWAIAAHRTQSVPSTQLQYRRHHQDRRVDAEHRPHSAPWTPPVGARG